MIKATRERKGKKCEFSCMAACLIPGRMLRVNSGVTQGKVWKAGAVHYMSAVSCSAAEIKNFAPQCIPDVLQW